MRYDVFLSYRRKGGFETAKHLYDLLTKDGYKVFFDLDTLRKGDFDKALLSNIEECRDFILIVDSNAFDRSVDPNFDPKNDWVRQELAYALKQGKNVIPVLLSGAVFPDNLPPDINQVVYKHGPSYSLEYFDSFYKKLKQFLHISSSRVRNIWFLIVVAILILVGLLLMVQRNTRTDLSDNSGMNDASVLDSETTIVSQPVPQPIIVNENNDNESNSSQEILLSDKKPPIVEPSIQDTRESSRNTNNTVNSSQVSETYYQVVSGVNAGREYVDLGLSVMWATCNLGAFKPSDTGRFFAWGEVNDKSDYTWDTYTLRTSGTNMYNAVFSKYDSGNGSLSNLETTDDAACSIWSGGWRIPTKADFEELINNCKWNWTMVDGVYGYVITSKKSGFDQNSIFMPAAGFMQRKTVQDNSSHGSYWTSVLSTSSHSAFFLGFNSTQVRTYSLERYIGCSIRAVYVK